jgi:putative ABC transport system ATP-binding protein
MEDTPVQPLLDVRDLSKEYRNAGHVLAVLRGVSVAVMPGETCAIVGPSGSGKTTLLGLAAGLDVPTSGSVRLAGHDLGALDEDQRAAVRNEHTGFVFQNFQLFPTLTALENVLVPLELRGGRSEPAVALELLAKVGLGERAHHYPVQLSGGEQQRVAIARAFVTRPRLLFADEPTGNLDGDTARRVADMIFDLNRDAGTALVLVTHDIDLAARCSQVVRLRNGQRVEP